MKKITPLLLLGAAAVTGYLTVRYFDSDFGTICLLLTGLLLVLGVVLLRNYLASLQTSRANPPLAGVTNTRVRINGKVIRVTVAKNSGGEIAEVDTSDNIF